MGGTDSTRLRGRSTPQSSSVLLTCACLFWGRRQGRRGLREAWGYRLYATQRDNPGAFRPWLLYRSTPQSSRSVLTCVCLGPAKVAGLVKRVGGLWGYRLYASQRSIRNSAISARSALLTCVFVLGAAGRQGRRGLGEEVAGLLLL